MKQVNEHAFYLNVDDSKFIIGRTDYLYDVYSSFKNVSLGMKTKEHV